MLGNVDAGNLTNIPGIDLNLLMNFLLDFFLVSLRLGALLVSSPIFGARSVPVRVRVLLTFVISAAYYGSVSVPNFENLPFLALIRVMGVEVAIGLTGGIVLSILFASVALAGEKIAASGGLGFAAQVDPNSGGQTPVVSQFLTLFLLTMFLSANGHLRLIEGLRQSFDIIPMGQPVSLMAMSQFVIDIGGEMFYLGALLMLPVVSILLLVNVTIGVVTRSAPALNFFSFGFPLTMMALFIVMYIYTKPLGFAIEDLSYYTIEVFERLFLELRDG
ncbi:MAG: flagellar biosynthetic protein FliR [Paracoccaceae bacterium]|nr:flagellar biosynthetic protein FliR [Paracoccaceae bacterium]MDA9822107.1 flagellar biosynthetic protein FliR [Paracoccaceae bacterium]MDB2423043.1 flagellar biosynthetic protein FliR [Paracoccaceae bacterium]MDB3929971.1 flagellar biosynthetic protein FliR [Paracoccaceae bacterium]MDG1258545.1 flagellar biosynthetic protein FliR [Paracoccaceae bacterium]